MNRVRTTNRHTHVFRPVFFNVANKWLYSWICNSKPFKCGQTMYCSNSSSNFHLSFYLLFVLPQFSSVYVFAHLKIMDFCLCPSKEYFHSISQKNCNDLLRSEHIIWCLKTHTTILVQWVYFLIFFFYYFKVSETVWLTFFLVLFLTGNLTASSCFVVVVVPLQPLLLPLTKSSEFNNWSRKY